MGFETILPFLRPIEPLLNDTTISEIMINPGARIFVERAGVCEQVADIEIGEQQIRTAAIMIARHLGDDVGEERPLLDARLPDGSRVAVAFPPCSIGGTTLTIRKFQRRLFTLEELVRVGTVPRPIVDSLRAAIAERKNVLISGGTGSGKTTLLNGLASLIAPVDRVAVIEDTAELQITQPNQLRLEARREHGAIPGITIRDLLKAILRHRPDRIIVGEVRGAEAFDLLQGLNTGHAGSLATIHANGAALALNRLTTCVLMSGIGLPFAAIRSQIADSINLLIHVERRLDGSRCVAEVLKVIRYDGARDQFDLSPIFLRGEVHATPLA